MRTPEENPINEIRRPHHGDRSAAARENLETAEKLFGFIPNLLGVWLRRPSRWRPTSCLTKLLEDASLSPVEQQVVMLAGSHEMPDLVGRLSRHTLLIVRESDRRRPGTARTVDFGKAFSRKGLTGGGTSRSGLAKKLTRRTGQAVAIEESPAVIDL